MRFDFIAARQEGYSDDEIADFLAKENGFDLAAARAEGYKTSEILEFLSEPPLRRLPAAEAPAVGGDPQFPDPYGAEPAKRTSSVLEGVFMPEPKFDPAEGERLSRRAANEPRQPRRELPGAEMRQGREVEPRSAARAMADTALGLGQGAVGMVKGVADNIDAGDNAVSRTLDQAVQGLEYFKSDALRDQAVRRDALISTVQKNQGELAAARAALNSIGLFPAATGDVAARGAGSLLPTVGMGVAGLGPASMWATNALANAGDAASQTADALRRLPASEWQNDERYLSLLKDGQTHEQAVATLAPIYALPSQALGALTGFLSGRTGLERVIAGRGVGSGMRARVGAAGAEALGEQAETLVPQAAGNLIVGSVDQTTGLTDSLGRAAVDTAIGSAPGAAIAAAAPVRNEQPVTAPIAAIAPAQTTDEAIIAAARALDVQPAEQAVANIERILGDANVSTPPAVPGSDTAAAGRGVDLAAPSMDAGVGNDGGAVPAVDARGPAAELPAADLPQPTGPDLDALRGENAALRSTALQALEAQQVPAAPADALPAARGDEPADQLPAAGSAPVETGGVAPAATPAVEVTRRNNGTVVLKGDTQQILAALATQGLTGIPGNAGVIVGKSQAQQAATLFQQPDAAPNPEEQRAEFQAAEAKRQARASRLRAGAFDKNPIMAFLGKHGISLQLASEFAPGPTERRKAIVPGYGPVFRRNGMNLDLLAERAAEEGFLPPGSRDDRARFEDYLQADPLLPDDIEDAIQDVTSDPALEAELRALLAAAADEGIDTEAVLEKAAQIAENGNQDEYTRQAIADVTAARASRGDTAARASPEQGRPAAQRKGREAGQPDSGPEGDQQVLTAPTRADVEAQQDRAATAEDRDQREQVRRESEAGAGLFSLTQEDGRQDTTGSLFDQPEAPPAPATEKPVSQMSAADLLRAAADKMEAKPGSASSDSADTQAAFFEKALEAAKRGSKPLGYLLSGQAFISEIDNLLKVPSNTRVGGQSANTVDGLASTGESSLDGMRSDAKALRNVINSEAFLNKGFRGLNAKTQRLVFSHVFRLIRKNQVRQIVVELIPVDVVDNLSRAQLTPDGFLNNPAVFKEALSGSLASPVSLRGDFADTLVRAIAYAGAKVSSARVLPDLKRPAKNGSPAVRAANGDFRHRGNDTRDDGETDQGVAMYARGGQDQTDTPAFKKWFGDSKVVDDQGKPMVVYHGAGDSIHSFVDTKGRGAYYFTPNAEFASGFAFDAADSINENDGYDGEYYSQMESAGANTMPVYLSAQNPFDPRNQKHVDALIDEAGLGKNDAVRDIWRRRFSAGMYDDLEPYYQDMQALGFDGFYEKENGDQSFWNIGVFRPEQIKSATGNRGTFDPSDPDITMARGVMDAAAFRRAFGAPEPMGVDRTQQIVDELTRSWENGPAFEIVATAADMPGGRHPSDARGLILNGTAYIVAANNSTRDAVARTLGHEAIGHYGLWKMLGEDGTRQFRRNVQLAIQAGNKPITAIRDKVRELYVDERGRFNLTPEQEADEIAAFAVEEGIDPVTGEFRPGFGFLKSVWAKIAAFLRDTLGLPVRFTNAELQGLLVQSMRGLQVGQRLEGGADMMVAAARDVSPEGKALQALSENDDLFALPKSDKTTVAEIAADNDPGIKVRQTKIGAETLYTLTMPNGEDAKLWVRPANPYGEQIYSMDLVDGDTSNVETGRPGENPEDVDPAVDDVYLDVSNLKPGQAGVKAYNIAATFAHNTGRIFIGDPSGLSDIAMRRRLENMISTALKFGTTDHIAPHPRQVKGDAKLGIPPLKWVYGDSLGNIRRMIDVSLRLDETGALPKYDYDTATGTFHPRQVEGDRLPGDQRPAAGQVRPVSERDGQAPAPGGSGVSGNDRGKPVAGDAYAAGGGLPAVPSAYGKRSTTLARAAIFRALLREAGEGGSGAQRGRDGLLAGLVRVANQYPGATKGIFYARGPAGAGQPGVTPPAGTPPATPTTSSKPGNAWSLPPDTRTDRIIYDLQDGRVDLKRVQQAIKDAGNQIDELWDARLAETLYPGRVAHRSKQFLDAEVKPLLQAMALNKVEMNELSDYLHARGAEERNAQIAKVNPAMPDGGAGKNSKGVLMTNQAAKAYLATIGQTRKAVLDSLAKRVDAITSGTRKLLVSEGLEKQETIDAWEAAYKNYVPMFRDEAESGAPHPQGMGFAVKGSASRRATGSTKQVTNMLAHVLMQREAAITRAEKNHVAMALYGLALSNPNPEFWTTIRPSMSDAKITAELQAMGVDPATAALGMERAPTIRTVDEATGKVMDRPNPMYRNLPGAITLKVNGEDRVLMLNVQDVRGQRLAENLKNLDGLTRIDIAGSIVGKTTRWLAAVNTQYNPVFGLKNVVRDVLGGTINLGSTALRGNALKVLRDTTPAMQGIARELAMPGKGGTWGKLWQQFQEDGGKTGWKENWRDPQERARAIEAELKAASSAGKLTPGKAAHAIFDLLDGFNTTLENSVRLSAYKAALDKGMSRAEAARLGRELTVDFNRKGRAGREVSPIYAFFNASVQGTARFIETIKGPTGKYVIPGGLALGVIQALMLAAAGYEEDEIPEFEKARGFIIPIGLNEEGKRAHIIIPISLGFHAIPNTGRILTEMVLSGGKDLGAKSFKALAEVAAAMNPLGGGDVTTLPGALTTLAPTVIDPLLELGFNKNFAGNPIEREKYRETDTRPGAARVKESTQRSTTGQAYLGISEAINAMTGGTKYEAGVISPTPERLRYLAQTVGGGVLRETEKIINGLTSTEPVKPNQIPVVGSFYGEVDNEQVQASRYFRNKDKTESAQSSFKAMEKAGDGKAMKEFMKDHPEILAAEIMGEVQRDIDELNKLAVTVIANPKLMAEIDARRTKLMTSANAAVKKLEDMQAKKQGTGPTLGEKLRPTQKAAEPVN